MQACATAAPSPSGSAMPASRNIARPGRPSREGGGVGGAVIHHDQLGAGDRIAQRRQGLAQAVGLVSFRKANKREVRQYENAK